MKLLIIHASPDVDALASVWLVRRFLPGFDNATVKSVQAGTTYENQEVDTDENILHLDTGGGKFDHHDDAGRSSATSLVYNHLLTAGHIPQKRQESIRRLVELVTRIDNFEDVNFPTPMDDLWCGFLTWILDGHKKIYKDIEKNVEFAMQVFDSMQLSLQNKINAEQDLEVKGERFDSIYGRSIAVYTDSELTIKLAQQIGNQLVIAISPRSGNARIKLHPQNPKDLSLLFEKIKSLDKTGNWHYHTSGHMLINPYQPGKNEHTTSLRLDDLVKLAKGQN